MCFRPLAVLRKSDCLAQFTALPSWSLRAILGIVGILFLEMSVYEIISTVRKMYTLYILLLSTFYHLMSVQSPFLTTVKIERCNLSFKIYLEFMSEHPEYNQALVYKG